LTLILKPTTQPPFDFPFISYFLYKGVDPGSLLVGGASGQLINAGPGTTDNDLVAAIKASWSANSNTGPGPGRECLGLHLIPTSDPAFAIDKPLENLFYGGDSGYPPILVNAGNRIGDFVSTGFGLDVVVERIGRPAPIKYAITRASVIQAPPSPLGPTPPNDAGAFMSRHARDGILDFVDPCAFWGSFIQSGLRAAGRGRVEGGDVYSKVLASPDAGTFANRNKAYLDIRDDQGHSMNYYRANGDEIQLSFDLSSVPTPLVNYYDQGWPCFVVPLPSAPLPDTATLDVAFALPAMPGSRVITYIAVGYKSSRKKVTALPPRDRPIVRTITTTGFPERAILSVPLADDDGTRVIHGTYHKLQHFHRPAEPAAGTALMPESLEPFYQASTDHLYPMPGVNPFQRTTPGCMIRVYADLVLVTWPGGSSSAVLARPGIARDVDNVYLFLLPIVGIDGATVTQFPAALPSLVNQVSPRFRPDLYLEGDERLVIKTIQVVDDVGVTAVQVLSESVRPLRNEVQSDNFWALALSPTDLSTAITQLGSAVPGTATLSLAEPVLAVDPDLRQYLKIPTRTSYVQAPSASDEVALRVDGVSSPTVYRYVSG